MKLILPIANIVAVTNLMLKHGSGAEATLVPATAVSFKGEVDPKMLDQLREGLSDIFFEKATTKAPRVPSIPELYAMSWKTEYEGGTFTLDLNELDDLDFELDETGELQFAGVDVKALTFEPLAKGLVLFTGNAIVPTDKDGRGQLAALVRHTVKATFSKLTQKALAEPEGPQKDANPDQGKLPIEGVKEAPPTTDGQPIVPLVH